VKFFAFLILNLLPQEETIFCVSLKGFEIKRYINNLQFLFLKMFSKQQNYNKFQVLKFTLRIQKLQSYFSQESNKNREYLWGIIFGRVIALLV